MDLAPVGGPPPGGFGGPPPGGPPPGGGYGGPPGLPPGPAPIGALYSGPSSPPPVPPAVAENVDWMPGEQVHACITADGFFVGAHPIAKLIAAWNAFITKLTFGHNRVHVVVTNQRVMLVQSVQMMCGFAKSKGINAIPVGSLVEAGWAKQTVWCCIHTRAVTLKSKTQTYNLVVKKINDQQMREFMTNASGTITANALAGTAT